MLGFTGDVGKEGHGACRNTWLSEILHLTPCLLVIFLFVVPFSKSNQFMLVGEQGNSVDDSPVVNLSAAFIRTKQ